MQEHSVGIGAHRVGAALALTEVVVDIDCLLHIWTALPDSLHHIHHQIQHVAPVLEGILLAPLHVLQILKFLAQVDLLRVTRSW